MTIKRIEMVRMVKTVRSSINMLAVFTMDVIFQRQHGSTKFSLSADRKFLLLHSYLYRVFVDIIVIVPYLTFSSKRE